MLLNARISFLCQNIFVTYVSMFMLSMLYIYVGMCILRFYEYVHVTLLSIHPSAIGLFSYID